MNFTRFGLRCSAIDTDSQLLIKNPGRVFSADEIYERIWHEKAVNTDTIMVHVRNIREKIEIDPKNPTAP